MEKAKSLSVEEMAQILSISLLLAQERLQTAERAGKICRDESIEGLRFYPNLFLQNASEWMSWHIIKIEVKLVLEKKTNACK